MEEPGPSRLGWVLVAIGLLVVGAGVVVLVGPAASSRVGHLPIPWIGGRWQPATARTGCGTHVSFDDGYGGYQTTEWPREWAGQPSVRGEARVVDERLGSVEFRSGDVTIRASRSMTIDCA